MRFFTAAFLASLGLAAATPVLAQTVDSGREIQVNPAPAGGGGMLLYPGGQFMRVVPTLRQPGDTGSAIRLHMPIRAARRPSVQTAAAPPPPPPKLASAAPPRKPAPAPAPVAPPAAPTPGRSQGAAGAAGIFGNIAPSTVTPARPTTAPAEPSAGIPGLTNHTVILFAADADQPADTARDAIRFLAGNLSNSMKGPQSQVWLMGHGGPKGDKGSDARRISLKRALSVRQLLIDSGLPTERINVQAQGGVDDSGPADRVDVYVKE